MAAFQSGVFNVQEFTDPGLSLVSGRLYTRVFGTTTHKVAYTDAAGTTPHTYTLDNEDDQYIALDARGELPAPLYLTTGAYDLVLKTAAGATIWTRRADPIDGAVLLAATLAGDNGAGSVGFIQSGAGAVATTVQTKARELISVLDFGATGDGTTNDHAAILAGITKVAANGGGTLWFPTPSVGYAHATTISGLPGVRLEGEGAQDFWRSSAKPVKLIYTGDAAAVSLAPGAASNIESFTLANLHLDGTTAGSNAVGLLLDATAAGSYIFGVLVEGCAITNFPVNQVLHEAGDVFAVTYRDTNLGNPDRTMTSHCAWLKGTGTTQTTFDNCYITPYTDGLWGVVSVNGDVRFKGGTVAPYGSGIGANGVLVEGSLTIIGTHFENLLTTNEDNIGIQYKGSGGAFIAPSECSRFGRGVKIGDGSTDPARGWVIAGSVGFNNTLANTGGAINGYDLEITGGGSRVGTIVTMGFAGDAGGAPTILDTRYDGDGASEVIRMETGTTLVGPILYAPAGSAAAPSLSFRTNTTIGLFDAGSSVGVGVGGVEQARVSASGLTVVEGFGCNGKAPQTEVTVNAAASGATAVEDLVNQLRAALIANGIVV